MVRERCCPRPRRRVRAERGREPPGARRGTTAAPRAHVDDGEHAVAARPRAAQPAAVAPARAAPSDERELVRDDAGASTSTSDEELRPRERREPRSRRAPSTSASARARDRRALDRRASPRGRRGTRRPRSAGTTRTRSTARRPRAARRGTRPSAAPRHAPCEQESGNAAEVITYAFRTCASCREVGHEPVPEHGRDQERVELARRSGSGRRGRAEAASASCATLIASRS